MGKYTQADEQRAEGILVAKLPAEDIAEASRLAKLIGQILYRFKLIDQHGYGDNIALNREGIIMRNTGFIFYKEGLGKNVPIPNYTITTHGPNSPVVGGDIKKSKFTKNEESGDERKNKILGVELSRKQLNWTIAGIVIATLIALLIAYKQGVFV